MATMSNILHEKNALITGAGSGIGYEAALLFAKQGANVLMVDLPKTTEKEKIATMASQVKAALPAGSNVKVEWIEADVSDEENFKLAVEKASLLAGPNKKRLDIMFNNAGIQLNDDWDFSEDTKKSADPNKKSNAYETTMKVNVKGVLIGCKLAIDAMKATGGSIINSSNFGALVGSANPHVLFAASKGAVISLTRELAVAHAKDKIRINTLIPGPVKTPQSFDALSEDAKKEWIANMPICRAAEPLEIANAALFLASDLSTYMTGSEVVVDGGASISFLAHPTVGK